jgi:flagellin-specific chaperone FliS
LKHSTGPVSAQTGGVDNPGPRAIRRRNWGSGEIEFCSRKNNQVDAAIFSASFWSGIAGDRMKFRKTRNREPFTRDQTYLHDFAQFHRFLVVALYDGIIRFPYAALDAVDRGDQDSRRIAVKRALDILIHLQAARLRMDIGGRPAQALSEFYASIFAQIMQASQSASRQKFNHAIECVRDVRDAETGCPGGESRRTAAFASFGKAPSIGTDHF